MRSIVIFLAGLISIGCQQKIIQSASSPSTGSSYCSNLSTSATPATASSTLTTLSTFRDVDQRGTSIGKVKLDLGSIQLPSFEGFNSLFPNRMVQRHGGLETHVVGRNTELVAVIDHDCTAAKGVRAESKYKKLRPTLTESLMDKEDELLQNPTLKYRLSSKKFKLGRDMTLGELAELLERDSCVKVVGSNATFRTSAPNDTHYAANHNQKTRYLDAINFADAYDPFFINPTAISEDVVIAVIDSGTRITHEDLTDNVWTNTAETPGNGIDDDANGRVDDINGWNFRANIASPAPQTWVGYGGAEGHGTHVAGIIVGERNNGLGITGIIGTNSKLMALNVFGNTPSTSSTYIDQAIAYAVNNGANVINLSLGGESYASSTLTAITNAVAAGVVVIAAAGNGDSNGNGLVLTSSYGIYPASFAKDINGMLSVGSTDGLTGSLSTFSNCSSTYVEIAAPGAYDSTDGVNGGIPSTWHTTDNAYVYQNGGFAVYGTSMAAPVVSGAAALAMSLYKTNNAAFPTPAQVETWITQSGATNANLNNRIKNSKALDLDALFTLVDAQ